MKIVGATDLGDLWALELACHTRVSYSSTKTIGATVLGSLWALECA